MAEQVQCVFLDVVVFICHEINQTFDVALICDLFASELFATQVEKDFIPIDLDDFICVKKQVKYVAYEFVVENHDFPFLQFADVD